MHGVVVRRAMDTGHVDALLAQEIREAQALIHPPRYFRRVVGNPGHLVGREHQRNDLLHRRVGVECLQCGRDLLHERDPATHRVVAMIDNLAGPGLVRRAIQHDAVTIPEPFGELLYGVQVHAGVQGQQARVFGLGLGQQGFEPLRRLGARRAVERPHPILQRLGQLLDDGVTLPAGRAGHRDQRQLRHWLRGFGVLLTCRLDLEDRIHEPFVFRLDGLLGHLDGRVSIHPLRPFLLVRCLRCQAKPYHFLESPPNRFTVSNTPD